MLNLIKKRICEIPMQSGKNKFAFIMLLLTIISGSSIAQNVLDGVYVKEHHPVRKPLPYPYLREADVMWSRRIWRVIDLKEKINLPLAYPDKPINDRKPLIDILLDKVKEGSLTAYDASDPIVNDEFTLPITYKEIEKRGGARLDTTQMTRPDPPYDQFDTIIKKDFTGREKVVAYLVKEEWFFEKQRSVMDVRIIGIAPLIIATREDGSPMEGAEKLRLCWFYYPECRNLLAQEETFNRQNDAARLTFEDIFQKRMFNSYIVKESNVYDRKISAYKTEPIQQVLESQRIKNEIMTLEHDMWEY